MKRRTLLLMAFASFAASMVFTSGSSTTVSGQGRRPSLAPIPDDAPPRPENATSCNYQEPIPWLVRENFLPRWTQPPEEQRRRQGLQKQTQDFRTENYGYFEGFGRRGDNESSPMQNATRIQWMGLPIRINERIVPALECVEEQIRAECGDSYTPVRLSGIRPRNTYHNGQVSNHVYGIAIDVDPHLNTCCRCVAQWGDHPLCQREVESIYERMAMPACWVHVFERFGFYWLGRDRLQDTMHFEFLGDPAHILKTDGMPPHMSEAAEAAGAAEEGEGAAEAPAEAPAEGAPAEEAAPEAQNAAPEAEEAATAEAPVPATPAVHADDENLQASAAPASSGGCGAPW